MVVVEMDLTIWEWRTDIGSSVWTAVAGQNWKKTKTIFIQTVVPVMSFNWQNQCRK